VRLWAAHLTESAGDTTLARIIELVEQAQARRSPSEQWVDRFARVYTPVMMGLALLIALVPPLFVGDWGGWIYRALVNKYGFDDFNRIVFAMGARKAGGLLWQTGDVKIIDGVLVNGAAQAVRWFSGKIRTIQTGHLYDYAFTMIIGLLVLLAIFAHRILQ